MKKYVIVFYNIYGDDAKYHKVELSRRSDAYGLYWRLRKIYEYVSLIVNGVEVF